ncbi:hypothetical protein FD49_GL001302 [Latilactobacillus sakei subsp. sakei DSM 20017 = JCM 1157]|uniref:helix-turn-helix transcriptional regulator n=3 Tax=Latilactobacillus sakei TaxID=1599 RepID=UPI0004682136|nr:AraC family transcriptional regulator [Latilactobacillus sakei]KRK71351.1 hypothetical protein FD49_GL001302 [Latilactobacillus sakei subsp. sakei DSM 20017 = JCM 1157]MDG9751644.1 AraC family transcriptional regulator [Latilactobacillus sakei]TDG57850.1 hypothetical protein C5L17_001437 [Latilactobacillus sakei subsp. sakei]USF99328.1 hypothetical protein BHU02_00925 [Latilactobacillus sakei subsp. sakei]BAX65813.1 hypothetical protein LACBS_00351 [Latilactobacillus sakei subsp. sakei DSM 
MPGIFNFPYLKLKSILTVSEQPQQLGANHHYQQAQTYLLLYIKSGQVILEGPSNYIINPNELLIVPTDKQVNFAASVPETIALHLIFQAESTALNDLSYHTFSIADDTLLTQISQESQEIAILRSRKPEIAHDVEIGEFFTVSCALLYADVTRLLLTLSEQTIKTRLPESVITEQPSPDRSLISTKQQLAYSKTISGTLYKNLLVNQIITYMHQNLEQTMTIDSIAQEFLVGSANLKKIFKQETGTSIMTYFKTIKMDTAKEWLAGHQKSITEIANQLGFSSSHHFSTAFKKSTGLSPTDYYKQLITIK